MSHSCNWCASARVRICDRNAVHKVDKNFGPFDLFVCRDCGSLGTNNPPSTEKLAEFYRAYESHRPDWYRAGAASGALAAQYRYYAHFVVARLAVGGTSWADIGAGHGEVATLVEGLRPELHGTAVDIGERPPSLPAAVTHRSVDFNMPGWSSSIPERFDIVYSIAVWEHVLSPKEFVKDCLALVAPGGVLVMVTPDFGSPARRVLGKRWPYYQPGEHISIPTLHGATVCAQRAVHDCGYHDGTVEVISKPVWVGYSLRYLMQVLRFGPIARLLPAGLAVPLPTGILATTIRVPVATAEGRSVHGEPAVSMTHTIGNWQ